MRNLYKQVFFIVIIAIIGFTMTGCLSNTSNWLPHWWTSTVPLDRTPYTVLGEVRLEKSYINVLGIYGSGGVTYHDLLDEAQRRYRDTDAIIDMQLSRLTSKNPFFARNRYIATGYAIKYHWNRVQ